MTYPTDGTAVVTAMSLMPTSGMMIHQKHIACRRHSTVGIVRQAVPGHGGDVWFVEHPDGQIAAYALTEMALIPHDEAPS